MPRCVECHCNVARIVQPEMKVVERCAACGRCCDRYYEFTNIQKWIDIVILERRAWTHVLFNQRDLFSALFVAAIISCLIEAYVVRTTCVYASLREGKLQLPTRLHDSLNVIESLQLVRTLRDEMMPVMMYSRTLPTLFLYACVEYFLCLVVAVWVGAQSQCGNDVVREDSMVTWATSVSVAYVAKLGYLVFLVWCTPVALIVVVDFVFLIWVMRGFSITAYHSTRLFAFVAMVSCVLTRIFFRHITGWGPQLIV